MASPAPGNVIDITIDGDDTGFVTGTPPNDASGDLDDTIDIQDPNYILVFTTWEVSGDPGLGDASINPFTGEWTYAVDPDEFALIDDGQIVDDTFTVTFTAYAFDPGGGLVFETETADVTISIEGVCFTLGTLIDTDRGPVPIEELSVGDRVATLDHGFQPIRWVESSVVGVDRLAAHAQLRPVRIGRGALGRGLPKRDLVVSQQHRILITGPKVELLFGEVEVLVAAKALLSWPGVTLDPPAQPVRYFHILLDRHEILSAEGAPAESLYLGEEAVHALSPEGLAEVSEIFADRLGILPDGFGPAARRLLRDYEAATLSPQAE